MSKIISYKQLSIGAVLLAAALALQFLPTSVRAQVPAKLAPSVTAPAAQPVAPAAKLSADALTPAQEAQLRAIAEGPLEIVFQFAAILKSIFAMKTGETAQVSVPEKNSNMQVAAVAERNSKGFCVYLQDGITFDFKKPLRVARAQSGFGLGLIIDKVLAQNSATVTFDPKFPNSVCFENVRRRFTFFGSIVFAQSIVDEVLAQGAALIAQAKAAACPKTIRTLVENIETACINIKNASQCYAARQAALKKSLMKKNFVNCAISDYITPLVFDWGDADPAATGRTTAVQKGPVAAVNQKLKLGKIVDGERDANVIDRDGDDGLISVATGGDYEVKSTALVGARRAFLTVDRFVRPGVVERLRGGPVTTGEAVTNIGKLQDGLYRIYLTAHPVPGPGVGKTGRAPGGNLGTGEIEDWLIPLTKQNGQNGVVCAAVLDYVCGVDGRTYNNECEAGRAGVKVAAKGECGPITPTARPGCPPAPAVQCVQGTVPQTSVGADGCQVTTCVPSGTPTATLDFGDARLGFPTIRTENGPRHVLSNRVWFGERIDGESNGLRVNRDDEVGVDDEDGMIQSNPQFILRVRTGPAVASTVFINAWEDWNANNRWDVNANGAPGDEWIVRNQPVQVRPNSTRDVALIQPRIGANGQPMPAAWSDPAFWLRFTVTETRIANGNPALGQKPSGETEDYIGVPPPVPSAPAPAPAPAPAGGGAAASGIKE